MYPGFALHYARGEEEYILRGRVMILEPLQELGSPWVRLLAVEAPQLRRRAQTRKRPPVWERVRPQHTCLGLRESFPSAPPLACGALCWGKHFLHRPQDGNIPYPYRPDPGASAQSPGPELRAQGPAPDPLL